MDDCREKVVRPGLGTSHWKHPAQCSCLHDKLPQRSLTFPSLCSWRGRALSPGQPAAPGSCSALAIQRAAVPCTPGRFQWCIRRSFLAEVGHELALEHRVGREEEEEDEEEHSSCWRNYWRRMLESDSPRIVFDAAHPYPFETYTKPQQEVLAPFSQQFCVLDSCERSRLMHGIPGSSYSREKDGETESQRDGNRRSNRSQLLLWKEKKHTQTDSQRAALQQNPNQQKRSREGDYAACRRWVLQQTTTITPT
jgi:hypothetical protein